MRKIHKSEYIKYSRAIVKNLHKNNCYGKGHMYPENLVGGLPDKGVAFRVLEALYKQRIVLRQKKKGRWAYHLNKERIDKIREIIKERGRSSIIPILLCLK